MSHTNANLDTPCPQGIGPRGTVESGSVTAYGALTSHCHGAPTSCFLCQLRAMQFYFACAAGCNTTPCGLFVSTHPGICYIKAHLTHHAPTGVTIFLSYPPLHQWGVHSSGGLALMEVNGGETHGCDRRCHALLLANPAAFGHATAKDWEGPHNRQYLCWGAPMAPWLRREDYPRTAPWTRCYLWVYSTTNGRTVKR